MLVARAQLLRASGKNARSRLLGKFQTLLRRARQAIKMAGIVLGAQSSLPSYFKRSRVGGGGEAKQNPAVTTFEKELAQVLSSLKKVEKKWPSWEFHQKVYVHVCSQLASGLCM